MYIQIFFNNVSQISSSVPRKENYQRFLICEGRKGCEKPTVGRLEPQSRNSLRATAEVFE